MENCDNIRVAIIREPSPFASYKLLGRKLSEYATRGVEGLLTQIVSCHKEINLGGNSDYLVVIYADMPLVTAELLKNVAKIMKKKGLNNVQLGRGYMVTKAGLTGASSQVKLNFSEFLSVIDTRTLNIVYNELRKRIIKRHLDAGVILNDDNIVIDDTARIDAGVEITGGSVICGESIINAGARIVCSRIEDSVIGKNTTVGPFAYVRQHSVIGEGVRLGDFVEVKKSSLACGVKCAHLSYIGDAEVGAHTNVGCGTVFCNYDGKNKHKTTVGEGVFIGANTNLVAPVTVGDGAFIAAGTTVTDNLENDSFCIGRVRQNVKPKRK